MYGWPDSGYECHGVSLAAQPVDSVPGEQSLSNCILTYFVVVVLLCRCTFVFVSLQSSCILQVLEYFLVHVRRKNQIQVVPSRAFVLS